MLLSNYAKFCTLLRQAIWRWQMTLWTPQDHQEFAANKENKDGPLLPLLANLQNSFYPAGCQVVD